MNAFEREIQKSAAVMGLHYQKVAVPSRMCFRGGTPRLMPLKSNGYDGYYVHNGRHIAVELKSSMLFESFPLSRIEQHQRDGLQAILDRGCPAFLLINMRWEMRDGKKKLNNRAWAFDWSKWGGLLDALGTSKSIPAEVFHSRGWFVPIPHTHFPDPASDSRNILCWDARSFLDRR
jgi:hypothetical protein